MNTIMKSILIFTTSLSMSFGNFASLGIYENLSQYVSIEKNNMEKPITINLVGDILLGGSLDPVIKKNGVNYPFLKVSNILNDADITFGNLETSVTTRGTASQKQFTFRSNPKYLEGMVNAGFDGVSLANNHSLDYGVIGLRDTFKYLNEYGFGYTGAGENIDESFKPFTKIVNGKKIAIMGISRVLPDHSWYAGKDKLGLASAYTNEPMMAYVRDMVKNNDYSVVFIHWNKELKDYPEDYARKMAKEFIDLGVDAVIGHHSHCLMGMEIYKGKPIYYSLGNFVFTNSKAKKASETMIVKLILNDDVVTSKITPAKIINGQPNLMNKQYNEEIISKLNKLSYNVLIDKEGNVLME